MRSPADKRLIFTLYSHPMKDAKLRWKGHLVFEPSSTDESFAELRLEDGEGAPIENGVFEFAGQSLAVAEGRAALRCGDFVRGKHERGIWLHRRGQVSVPGALTFE